MFVIICLCEITKQESKSPATQVSANTCTEALQAKVEINKIILYPKQHDLFNSKEQQCIIMSIFEHVNKQFTLHYSQVQLWTMPACSDYYWVRIMSKYQ